MKGGPGTLPFHVTPHLASQWSPCWQIPSCPRKEQCPSAHSLPFPEVLAPSLVHQEAIKSLFS